MIVNDKHHNIHFYYSLDEPSLMNFREGKRAFPHSDLGSDNLYFNKK